MIGRGDTTGVQIGYGLWAMGYGLWAMGYGLAISY